MGRGRPCIAKAGQLQNQQASLDMHQTQVSPASKGTKTRSHAIRSPPFLQLPPKLPEFLDRCLALFFESRFQRVLKLFFPIFWRVLTEVFQLIVLQ